MRPMMSSRSILSKSKDLPGNHLRGSVRLAQNPNKVFQPHTQTFTNPLGNNLVNQIGFEDRNEQTFNIVNWNAHNCNIFDNRESILSLKAHILILQEVNQQMKNRTTGLGYKWFLKERLNKYLGIAIPNNMIAKRREDLETLNSIIIQIFFKKSSIFIGSIHQTIDKKEFRTLLEMMSSFPLILGGDLNIQLRALRVFGFRWIAIKKDPFKKIEEKKQENNFLKIPCKKKIKQIDYIFYNQIFRIKQKIIQPPLNQKNQLLSDHNPIFMKLYMDKDIRMEFPFFDQQQAKNIINGKREEFNNLLEMIQIANQQLPSQKIVTFKVPSFQKHDQEFILKLDKLIHKNRKEYHQLIKHTSGLGKQKAGMIVNILDEGNNNFITDYKKINQKLILQLGKISLVMQNNIQRPWDYQNQILLEDIGQEDFYGLEIPDLSVTTKEEKNKICKEEQQWRFKWPLRGDKYEYYNKAVSYDWTHLEVIRKLWEEFNREDFSFINISELKNNKYTLQMRLIPINKVSPNVPNCEQIRPIVVMSHVIKMIELFYEDKLKEYVNYYINPEQIGFLQGMGTQIHIQELIRFLSKKGVKGKTAVFIDLSNAYNVVDRNLLYELMKKKQIFGIKALNFLFSLYDELYFWDDEDKQKYYLLNGLHHGFILSPYLFDIYFDELIEQWKQEMKKQALNARVRNRKKLDYYIRGVRILAYADDVVFLTNSWASKIAFQIFYETSKIFNFQINLKKTNFLSQTKKQELSSLGCNWVCSYKYLGIYVNIRGSIKPHYNIIKGIVKKNSWRIKFLSKLLPARHIFKLWQLYVKPYFDYISTALWLQKQTVIEQFKKLWRICLRIMAGLHMCMRNVLVENLFGQISYYGDTDQFLYKQEEKKIERWTQYYLIEEQKFQMRNNQQGYQIGTPFLPMVENKRHIYINRVRKDLQMARWEAILNRNVYTFNFRIPQWDASVIRKIPNVGFFDFFKYESMLCKECKVPLSLKHIDNHFQTQFDRCAERLCDYVIENQIRFDKGDQKFYNGYCKTNSKLLNKYAQQICLKRTYIKKQKLEMVPNQN